jgi:hypothetical protein
MRAAFCKGRARLAVQFHFGARHGAPQLSRPGQTFAQVLRFELTSLAPARHPVTRHGCCSVRRHPVAGGKIMKSSKVIGRSPLIIALALVVGGGYVAAQGKTAPPASAGQRSTGNTSAMKAQMKSCPMHEAAPIADATAENTADGAVIRLKAKKPGDVQRVQEMAAMMAEHMTGGGMEHGAMMHGGMHQQGSMKGGSDRAGMKGGPRESSPKPAAQPSNPHNH